jgi:hypothetical protein
MPFIDNKYYITDFLSGYSNNRITTDNENPAKGFAFEYEPAKTLSLSYCFDRRSFLALKINTSDAQLSSGVRNSISEGLKDKFYLFVNQPGSCSNLIQSKSYESLAYQPDLDPYIFR